MSLSSRIAVGTAYLVAFSAVDVSNQLIDFLTVPVPRQIMGMPWSVGLGVVALLLLWPAMRQKQIPLMGLGGVGVLAILVFWAALEVIHGIGGRVPSLTLVLSCVPALLVSQVARIHIRLFSDAAMLVDSFVNTAIVFAAIHLMLLLLASTKLDWPFADVGELSSRNSISLLLVVAVWVLGLLDSRRIPLSSPRFLGILTVAVLHIAMNSARAAALLLLLALLFIFLRDRIPRCSRFWMMALAASILIMVIVAINFPLMEQFGGFSWLGSGNPTLSARFRSEVNWLLLGRFLDSPLSGMGWNAVLDVRSGGYICHTFYLILLASYGLLGVLPLMAWLGIWLYFAPATERGLFSMTILAVVVNASFVNDPVGWYGLALSLASRPWGRNKPE